MKRTLTLLLFSVLLLQNVQAQEDFGYKTFDAGVDASWSPLGYISYSLQLASNAKTYHSFLFHAGFENVFLEKQGKHFVEKGKGWSIGAGYRYYFAVIPKRFFLGIDAKYDQVKIDWNNPLSEGKTTVHLLQPSLQGGYTAVINDQFFITIHAGVAAPLIRKLTGDDVRYGDSATPLAGLNMGWRF